MKSAEVTELIRDYFPTYVNVNRDQSKISDEMMLPSDFHFSFSIVNFY